MPRNDNENVFHQKHESIHKNSNNKNKYIKQAPDTNAFCMLRKYCLYCCIYNVLRETFDITVIQTFKTKRYYLFEFNNSVKYFPNRKC